MSDLAFVIRVASDPNSAFGSGREGSCLLLNSVGCSYHFADLESSSKSNNGLQEVLFLCKFDETIALVIY